jgi:hypothetical protein
MVTRSPVSFGVPLRGPHSPHISASAKRKIPAPQRKKEAVTRAGPPARYEPLWLKHAPASSRS